MKGAQVNYGFCAVGDDVGTSSAFDDAGVDGDAAARVIPFPGPGNLQRELMNCVNALFGGETGVGGAALDEDLRFPDAFACGLEQTFRPERRIQNENRVAALGLGFDQPARGFTADLFVG